MDQQQDGPVKLTDRDAAIAWGLNHNISTIGVTIEMTSEDQGNEWVVMKTGAGIFTGVQPKAALIDWYLFEELFDVGPDYPRSIARLKNPVAAQAMLEQKLREEEAAEREQLLALLEKYPDVTIPFYERADYETGS